MKLILKECKRVGFKTLIYNLNLNFFSDYFELKVDFLSIDTDLLKKLIKNICLKDDKLKEFREFCKNSSINFHKLREGKMFKEYKVYVDGEEKTHWTMGRLFLNYNKNITGCFGFNGKKYELVDVKNVDRTLELYLKETSNQNL